MRLPITYYSWEILTPDIAVKHGDISVFRHHGSGIPKQSRWFWGVEDLEYPEKHNLRFRYFGQEYRAYIVNDLRGSSRVFWHQELSRLFNKVCDIDRGLFPCLRFERIEQDLFEVSFFDASGFMNAPNDQLESVIYDGAGATEGRKLAKYTTKYERNPRNRADAIKIHGTKCMVCGFDFEKMYGEYGRYFIEVHHVKPLYGFEKEEVVNPLTDLVCLCSNCHRMIHRKRDAILSVEELKRIVEETKNGFL